MSSIHECRKEDCGEDFDTFQARNSHEGQMHQNIGSLTVSCSNCDTQFRIERNQYRPDGKNFCVEQCYFSWLSNNMQREDNPSYKGASTEIKCNNCGERRSYPDAWLRKKDSAGKFCSKECMRAHHNTKIECFNCSVEFERPNYLTNGDRQFCSKSCYRKFLEEAQENHPTWKGGKSFETYPREFYDKREGIIERDGKKCQQCNMSKQEHYEEYNEDLHVHHIDGDKNNNEDTNLVTLCHKHNIQAEYMTVRPQFDVGEAA